MSKLALTQKLTESERFPIHIGKTEAEKNPEDDSDAKISKGPKIKEINLKPDKLESTDEAPGQIKLKINFQPSGNVSNLSTTLLQKHSAVEHVSEFKEKLIADKLASTAKIERKQEISKKAPPFGPFRLRKADKPSHSCKS